MDRDNKLLLWLFLGSLFLIGSVAVVAKLARGIRNNNPGNIEKGIAWKGIDAAKTAQESRFIVFTAPEWGLRAMARLLKNYQRLYGLSTVRGIINRWAPPTENDTGAYVNAVARALSVDPDASISVETSLPALLKAIVRHENGSQPYPDSLIARGIELERTA